MALSLRVYTGVGAGTESAAQTAIALLSVDAATVDPGSHQVVPGANSYEKWVAVVVDAPSGGTYSNFWVESDIDPPAGVTVKVGIATAGATPTAATSTVARTTLSAGRRYLWDEQSYDTTGDRTRYLVIQEQVAATATSGAIPQQTLTFGWDRG